MTKDDPAIDLAMPAVAREKEMPAEPERVLAELQMDLDASRGEATALRVAQSQTEAALRQSRATCDAALKAATTAVARAAALEVVADAVRLWASPEAPAAATVFLRQSIRELDLAEGERLAQIQENAS